MHSDEDLDVVDLWSCVESIVFVARVARVAGRQGHQHIQAEGCDTHRSLGITDQKGQRCEYITCVQGFLPCTPTDVSVGSRRPLVDGSHLFIPPLLVSNKETPATIMC